MTLVRRISQNFDGIFFRFAILMTCAALAGCGSSDRPLLATVTGVVTIDGEPLTNAVVMFKPEGLRASRGFTNDQGSYELAYIRDIRGAAIGTHRVIIDRMPRNDGKNYSKLPTRYNVKSELTATVEPGDNQFDWKLTSDDS